MPESRRKLETLLFLNYHKLEKTLALAEVPPLFGIGYLPRLLDLLEQWARVVGDRQDVVFRGACGALAEYRARVGDRLRKEDSALAIRLDRWLADNPENAGEFGGTRAIDREEADTTHPSPSFDRVVRGRHSVRNFSRRDVPDDVIARAVRLAQFTPSDCNRQTWRVHVYSSAGDKSRVLRVQNGNAGFGHLAAHVLLVCADMRTCVTSGERHQGYVNCGMFAMTLIYGLQAEGVSSCCLNLARYSFQDMAIRRACRVPAWEVPVLMIAIGYPPAECEVAVSVRLPLTDCLSWEGR